MSTSTLAALTLPDLLASIGSARWRNGGFDAEGVAVEDLLAHAAQRLAELAEIKTLVPSEEAVLVMAPQPPEGAVQINITPGEWRVLVMVDGRRPVRDIAAAAGLDEIAAMKVLFGLATAGLVTLAAPAPAPETSEPEAAEPGPGEATPFPEAVSDTTDMTAVSDVSDVAPEERVYSYPGENDDEEAPAAEAEPPADPFLDELVGAAPPPALPAVVDRSTAARELAGLFDDLEGPAFGAHAAVAAAPPAPPRPRRLEDDDQVTRGLISRLIDGVKGL